MKIKYYKLLKITFVFILIFSFIVIYSASSVWSTYKYGNSYHYAMMQGFFILISIFIYKIFSKIDTNVIYKYSDKLFIFSCILLILVAVPFIGKEMNGSRSWFGIGPFGIQPSELAKISTIIFTSKFLESKKIYYFKDFSKILFASIFVFFLIMLEPDLGTSVIILVTSLAMIFISGAKKKYFFIMFFLFLAAFIVLVLVAPYRMRRITSFINPWNDPLDSGFQIIQSLYAIGPSGLLGRGLFNSIQKNFFLPEPQTDFIFSIIVEELGFVGAFIICFIYFMIIYIGIKVSLNAGSNFKKYLAFGITFSVGFQAVLNLMVATSLVPITGVTLPFISYGGSSFLSSSVMVFILLNIIKEDAIM